jgi:hypothetical protein
MATSGKSHGDLGAYEDYWPVTPSDSTDLAVVTRALIIGTAGTLKVTRIDGTAVTLTVPTGELRIRVVRVWATGTTASGITGCV